MDLPQSWRSPRWCACGRAKDFAWLDGAALNTSSDRSFPGWHTVYEPRPYELVLTSPDPDDVFGVVHGVMVTLSVAQHRSGQVWLLRPAPGISDFADLVRRVEAGEQPLVATSDGPVDAG